MSTVILKTLITFLAIFGLIQLVTSVFSFFKEFSDEKKELYVFIHVKNQENNIEYIVRTTILNFLNSYGGRVVPYIVIVDKGSDDRTEEISRRLCDDYEFIYYTTEEDYLKFKNEIQ